MNNPKTLTIDYDLIIKQVDKICRSEEFKSKKLLCGFLSFIVSECLAGREQNIKGYTIGVTVFNRGIDFDPSQDALVRIHAGRLRRMLDLYYHKEGKRDRILIEIPKGSYTPNISYNEHSNLQGKDSSYAVKKEKTPIIPTVIVFPFRNLTGDPEKESFALGFSEELSVELTKYEDLFVYNGRQDGIVQFDKTANDEFLKGKLIRFAIDGTVNLSGDNIKILVKLTDIMEGRLLWAESYHKNLSANNILDIREDIAREVAGLLGCEYRIILQRLSLDTQRIKPKTLDAFIEFSKFYYFQMHQTPEAAAEAFRSLKYSLEKEPESGTATAMLAIMHGNRFMLDYPNSQESFELMGTFAERAGKLDPNSMIVKVALAFKYFAYNEKDRFIQIIEKTPV
jgi:adenylate cyclase